MGPTPGKTRTPFASRVASLAVDATAVAGACAIIHGAWLIYHPAAYIVGGAFGLAGAWLVARKGAT